MAQELAGRWAGPGAKAGAGQRRRIENGDQNVTIRTLCKIAEALDMTVAERVAAE